MNEYRDFIDTKSSEIINKLNGTITPVPANTLYRDFLDIRFSDVINAIDNKLIKTFKYKGTGSSVHTIKLPTDYSIILDIVGKNPNTEVHLMTPYCKGDLYLTTINVSSTTTSRVYNTVLINDEDNRLTFASGNNMSAATCCNYTNVEHTVYYI